MHPSHIAIRNPVFVFLMVIMIVVAGTISYRNIPREAAPDIQIPLLIVTIPFPGASPEDVESLITNKAELELQTLKNLKEIKSTSSEGVSAITLEFTSDFDISEARTKVRETMDQIKPDFPDDVEDYIVTEINLSEQPLLIVNLSGNMGSLQLTNIADDLKDEIESIPGILEVRRAGGLEREIRVYVNPDKLSYYQLDLNQVNAAISSENMNLPGGTVTMGPTKYLIRVPGEFDTPEGINDALISAPGQVPVRVRDVANVVFGFKEITSKSRLDGMESISLSVIKRSGENLLAIRDEVKQIVAQLEADYNGELKTSILSDQGRQVQRIVRDLENNIVTGFILVFLVLLVVMGVSNALLVAVAIPLSFLVSIVVMQLLGFTLNIVVLFSLILALGMLVDNAIVVVENIFRHRQAGQRRREAAFKGVKEVAIPVLTSTMTTVAAFFPLIYMPGIAGEFISFMPKTVIITLFSSLFVALFINPVLASTMMRAKKRPHGTGDLDADDLEQVKHSRVLMGYQAILHRAFRFRILILLGFLGIFVGTFMLYANTTLKSRGVEFFPKTEPEEAVVNVTAPMGTTLEVSDEYVQQIEEFVKPHNGALDATVANVGQRRGFGASSSGSTTTYLSHVVLSFPGWEDWTEKPSAVIRDLRDKLQSMVGVEVKVSEAQNGPPTGNPLNIEVRGEEYTAMMSAVEEIKRRIKDTPGLVDMTDDFDRSRPEIKVMIDREKAARLGLRAQSIATTVRTAFNGKKVSVFRDGQDEYDIIVQLDQTFRKTSADLESLFISTPVGELVRLSEIARVDTGPSYGSIRHVGTDRVITISGDASGIPGPVLVSRAREKLKDLTLPAGVTYSFTGENKEQRETQQFIGNAMLIAVFLIFLTLVAQFNSLSQPLIILSAVFMSIMGVLIGLMVHDRPFGIIMSGVGTVSLAGIVVNNAIVMLDFVKDLRNRGYKRNEAMILAATVRFRPVMLTAITTVLGLIPMAAGLDISFQRDPMIVLGAAGAVFWQSMAFAIMYGLAVATFLTLVIVPVLYSLVEGFKERFVGWVTRLTTSKSKDLAEAT